LKTISGRSALLWDIWDDIGDNINLVNECDGLGRKIDDERSQEMVREESP
jgi:hypothetical protein